MTIKFKNDVFKASHKKVRRLGKRPQVGEKGEKRRKLGGVEGGGGVVDMWVDEENEVGIVVGGEGGGVYYGVNLDTISSSPVFSSSSSPPRSPQSLTQEGNTPQTQVNFFPTQKTPAGLLRNNHPVLFTYPLLISCVFIEFPP